MTRNENRPRPSHAAPGVRQNLEYPVIPLYQFLDDAVSSFPDAPAAIFAGSIGLPGVRQPGGSPGSYPRIRGAAGVEFHQCCPTVGNDRCLLRGFKGRAIVVQVSPVFSSRVENRLQDCGAETIILLDEYLPRLQAIQKKLR